MGNLEEFLNRNELADWDALTKMALIHHQIESIHPFYDGNGRTGRVLNILYLAKEKLLGSPVLYLSRYINQSKAEYYRLLQDVRDTRKTASKYLDDLVEIGLVSKHKMGKENFYLNDTLFQHLQEQPNSSFDARNGP